MSKPDNLRHILQYIISFLRRLSHEMELKLSFKLILKNIQVAISNIKVNNIKTGRLKYKATSKAPYQ